MKIEEITEKLADSNRLLVDEALSGMVVSKNGLVWKPQYVESAGKFNGLDAYHLVLSRATTPRWWYWRHRNSNASTIYQALVVEPNWSEGYNLWTKTVLQDWGQGIPRTAKVFGYGDTFDDAYALYARRRKLQVVQKLTNAA